MGWVDLDYAAESVAQPWIGANQADEDVGRQCLLCCDVGESKSLPSPSFTKHRTYLWGLKQPFEAFHARIVGFPKFGEDGMAWRAGGG
mmetsp:Transcript_60975/g.125686  ORF Transcript_60975/g.125686 Transcript_60975/m.125686 type:complete len:88 (-) Transcript_60975:8-271(-)